MSTFQLKNMVVSILPESEKDKVNQACALNTFRTTTVCVLHTTVTFCHHPTLLCWHGCTHQLTYCWQGCSFIPTPINCHWGCTFVGNSIVCQVGSNFPPGCTGTILTDPYRGGNPVEDLTALRKGLDELIQNMEKMDQPQAKEDLDQLESHLNEALEEVRQRKSNLNQSK